MSFLDRFFKNNNQHEKPKPEKNDNIDKSVDNNIKEVKKALNENFDVITRKFSLGGKTDLYAAIAYLDGMVDKSVINLNIIRPLMLKGVDDEKFSAVGACRYAREFMITANDVREVDNFSECINYILNGSTIVFIDGSDRALMCETKGWKERSIDEPKNEAIAKGPHSGFTETMLTNVTLIRRYIKDPNLHFEPLTVGKSSRTNVIVAFIDGVSDNRIVEEVKKRLHMIDIDAIIDSSYIAEFISDAPLSPFATIQTTERPDKVVANLLEGKVAIIVDGTPVVLVAPFLFMEFIQSPDDYYENSVISSGVRVLRTLSLFIAIFLPGFYIAVVTFNQAMIPTTLALSIMSGRFFIPFSPFAEIILLMILIEILREAGIHFPGTIGQTISIVGALVVGQSAVSAGLVSPFVVIVVSATTLASYAVPSYTASYMMRFLPYPVLIISGLLGIFGFTWCIIALLIHLASLQSFGISYLTPLAPFDVRDNKDSIFRMPRWMMVYRPNYIKAENKKRLDKKMKGEDK
ncbi:MAG: spore germination protein [Thermoanaerobacteraceae bacterium]|nr:spore germination protein [Thermoanaerobacteraceae bacterium]